MKIGRRDFLKGAAGAAALAVTTSPSQSEASEKERLPGALGILYDATLCIGCQVCMVACKKANDMPYEHNGDQVIWDNPIDLSSKTLNVIKKYEYGSAAVKDSEEGFAFIKRHCMHCVDPACTSACPVSALTKNQTNGVVTYNKDACIGCRYCQVACPFNIPKFEWDDPFPKIVKCQLCSHLIEKGGISACCSECPTGASLFGPVDQLLDEAKRRMNMTPGQYYQFPVGDIRQNKTARSTAGQYINDIYGESEVGGTQVLMLSGIPFDKVGLPTLPDQSYAALSESIQHTIYKGMIIPAVLFAGLAFVIKKNEKK